MTTDDVPGLAKVYKVAACNLDRLTERLGELAKRARRLKCEPPTWTIGATITEPRKDERGLPLPDAVFYEVTVAGERPRMAGWELVAVLQLEHDADGKLSGNILRKAPRTPELDLRAWRDTLPACDHCMAQRRRNETFLVRSEASGQIKQVGRNCIADFLGHRDPHRLAALAEIWFAVDDLTDGCDEEGYGGGGGRREWNGILKDFLVMVAYSIRVDGWTSRSKAREFGLDWCTADRAMNVLINLSSSNSEARRAARETWAEANDRDRGLAEAALASAQERLLDVDGEALSDYEHNLKLVVLSDVVKHKTSGLAASLVPWHDRELAKRLKKAKDADSKHVGTVGERAVFEGLTLETIISLETQFGALHIHKFRSAEGNILVWKTGKAELDQGWQGALKATVKAHDDYKGTLQTVLTRASVFDAAAEQAKKSAKKSKKVTPPDSSTESQT